MISGNSSHLEGEDSECDSGWEKYSKLSKHKSIRPQHHRLSPKSDTATVMTTGTDCKAASVVSPVGIRSPVRPAEIDTMGSKVELSPDSAIGEDDGGLKNNREREDLVLSKVSLLCCDY